MPKYIDEDGNEIELPVPLSELQASAKTYAEEKEKLAKDLEEAKKQVAEFGNKDLNWKRLRNMTKEETSKFTAREMEFMQRQEALEERTRQFESKQIEGYKKNALARFGAVDEETRAKILAQYDRLKDDASTEEEISNKMRDAFTIATGASPSSRTSPSQAMNYMGSAPSQPRNQELTADIVSLGTKLGLTQDDFTKYFKK